MFSFIITNKRGEVLDFGCYQDRQCAIDTANDSEMNGPGLLTTIVNHDDDGNCEIAPYNP